VLWLVATLGWWAFAFLPSPSPPAWLAAARVACFGTMERGLPDAAGWMMLALAPASLLTTIVVLWGRQLVPALRTAVRGRAGRVLLVSLAAIAIVESSWVAARIQTARTLETWTPGPLADEPLPAAYPRDARPAPGFTLLDQRGATVSLTALRGRPVVVSFVFAHCQTLCPFIVATLKRGAPADAAVLLVTLDPWRDTPSALAGIAARWELPDNFHVLSARAVDDAARVAAAYGVTAARDERTGDIVHPGLVFLIDREGQLAYTFANPPAAWVREAFERLGRRHVRSS
jgi:protein SCO1/2